MWADMIYTIPVASVLTIAKLEDDTEVKGDMQDAMAGLIAKYLPSGSITMVKNEEIIAIINTVYPKGTSLWTILDGIMATFGLRIEFKPMTDKCIRFMLVKSKE